MNPNRARRTVAEPQVAPRRRLLNNSRNLWKLCWIDSPGTCVLRKPPGRPRRRTTRVPMIWPCVAYPKYIDVSLLSSTPTAGIPYHHHEKATFLDPFPIILGRLDVWTFGRLDVWTFGRLDVWTFGRLDVWTFGSRPVPFRAGTAQRVNLKAVGEMVPARILQVG